MVISPPKESDSIDENEFEIGYFDSSVVFL